MPGYDRDRYLGEVNPDPGERADGGRWAILRVWRLSDTGTVPVAPDTTVKPVLFEIDFVAQETTKIDRERSQIVPSSHDDGKIYFFDREHRQYVFQGFVYDVGTQITAISTGEIDIFGRGRESTTVEYAKGTFGYSRFKALYERYYRASAAMRNRHIIELDMDYFRLWGFMTNMAGTHASDAPTMFVITFGLYIEAMEIKGGFSFENIGDIVPVFQEVPDLTKLISYESQAKIGLDEYQPDGDPIRVVIPADTSPITPPKLMGSHLEGMIREAYLRAKLNTTVFGLGRPYVKPKRVPQPPKTQTSSHIVTRQGMAIGPDVVPGETPI